MKRYETASEIKNNNEPRKLGTVILSAAPSSQDLILQTSTPYRLDLLAEEYYGDAKLWWIIASVNNLGKGSLQVPGNSFVRIPSKERVMKEIRSKNNNR